MASTDPVSRKLGQSGDIGATSNMLALPLVAFNPNSSWGQANHSDPSLCFEHWVSYKSRWISDQIPPSKVVQFTGGFRSDCRFWLRKRLFGSKNETLFVTPVPTTRLPVASKWARKGPDCASAPPGSSWPPPGSRCFHPPRRTPGPMPRGIDTRGPVFIRGGRGFDFCEPPRPCLGVVQLMTCFLTNNL